MKTEGWPGVAILRQCRRCAEWRGIEAFEPHGKICQRCVGGGKANRRIAIPRAIVLIRPGRARKKNSA